MIILMINANINAIFLGLYYPLFGVDFSFCWLNIHLPASDFKSPPSHFLNSP